MTKEIQIGDVAPAFTLPGDDEQEYTLANQMGKWTLIYFYPKDDTPGCTTEACAIRDIYDEFAELDITVFGVSKDSVASHKKFKEKYELPFILLSDSQGEVIQAYGAWKMKNMFGTQKEGIVRMSYLINPDGKIARVYPKVDPAAHALEILTDVRELIAS